jgi:hypothetical protein
MKRFLIGIFAAATAAAAAVAQPIPIFENFGTITSGTNLPPQIDALAFANYGTFDVSTSLPFDFTDVRYYTNSGTMTGSPGFIFDTAFSAAPRVPAISFVNASQATITASESVGFPFGANGFVFPTYLNVKATNVTAQGILSVSAGGLLRIEGQGVNLTRAGLEVRPISGVGSSSSPTNFVPDTAITDIYWALTNGTMLSSTLLDVSALVTNVNVPRHVVTNINGQATTAFRVSNPAVVAVVTNAVTPTNWVVQGAFVGITPPNLTGHIRVDNSPILTNAFKEFLVELAMPETNVVTGNVILNTLFITDELASNTNITVLSNTVSAAPGTYRPANYTLSRTPPLNWFTARPLSGGVRPDLFFDTTLSNNFTTNLYASYEANLSTFPVTPPAVPGFDVTNLPGRVEIVATDLNLNRTRMRGNALVNINTPNLLSSTNAIIDSPFLNFNLGAIAHVLNVTNLAQTTVARFSGNLRAWSAIWTNNSGSVSTNVGPDPNDPTMTVTNVSTNVIEIGYHIFVVDTSGLSTTAPVQTDELIMRGPDVVVGDTLNVTRTFFVGANSFTLSGTLNLSGSAEDWLGTNAPTLQFFTNNGTLFLVNRAQFTEGRGAYTSFVNNGSISASGVTLDTAFFENTGTITPGGEGMRINMVNGLIQGGTVNSAGDVMYNATDLKVFNSTNTLSGTLTLNVTDGLADSGQGSDNLWQVQNGFALVVKPAAGDLLGTTLHTVAPRFATVPHTWAAEDRGATAAGYVNNAAIGNLILDTQADGTLQFSPVAGKNAIYVDFLTLTNAILTAFNTGNLASALQIDADMTIYFAASNVPADQLNGQLGGQLVWVPDFIGPNSAVDVLRKNGQVVQMNISVRESTTIDSDGDGIPNAFDAFPLDPDASLALMSVARTTPPPTVSFTFDANPKTIYSVEYTSALVSGEWKPLMNYTNSSTTVTSAMVQDPVSSGKAQRYYRVRSVGQLK